jgi:hypothetical protein
MPVEPPSSYCGRSLDETARELIATNFVQFHMNGKVVTASIGGSRRNPTLHIAVACEQPHSHSTSLRPLRGTFESNFKSICFYLERAAYVGDVED